MPYKLRYATQADEALKTLESNPGQLGKLKKVRKALRHLETNPRHPGLHSHPYESFPVDRNVKVWDSYVENKTPGAWRIFWRYGPDEPDGQPVITVLYIGPHP
ncbi:MAG TPA: hypothetical protein VMF87_05015 [Streptosporangiaceae bacterium]|nr:hypothetical protein [Streptosporangiaceae bacterium]